MIKDRFEVWVSESGNVAVYRGNGFIPTEKLTEEERLFVLDKVIKELGSEHKVETRDSALEAEIKRYTEEQYHETFGHGQGTLDEFDWEDIAVTIEETAVHFVGWKEKAPEYKTISKILALGFIHFLDENRPEGKMCLSNGECGDIEKAFNEQDWPKLSRYLDKYRIDDGSSEILNDLT
jgi:hypothetical protein